MAMSPPAHVGSAMSAPPATMNISRLMIVIWFGVTPVGARIATSCAAIGRITYTLKTRSCFFRVAL